MIKYILSLLFCLNLAAQTHNVRVYILPEIDRPTAELVSRLTTYIGDLNQILAKNTNQRLRFAGIVRSAVEPISGLPLSGFSANPNFDINFSIGKTAANAQSSGAPVFFGDSNTIQVRFRDIYDPNNLPTAQISDDYLLQLHILIHEFGHIFGVAIGEYYSSWLYEDQTGIYPILPPINPYVANDVFWTKRYDFIPDPMLTFAAGGYWGHFSRQDYLDFVQFSNLSARIINRNLRYPTWSPAEAQYLTIEVARNGQVLANARVRIFVANNLVLDSRVAPNGRISIRNPLTMFSQIAIIKVEHGFSMGADYVSLWDIQNAGTLGLNELVYRINL